ncbi:uncharacterized protein [Alexandromys fortis]|uniref:uncharacterized protein n=1 Tax=Alexandromys fortis TaxID=100897 RepID=UPI002152A434|nr:uncharacterized protein LOC126503949 [Microtus fortis]
MLRRGAGARGSLLPATAARCLRRPLPTARTDENWGLVCGRGGDSLKCVRGWRAPGNPEAWIPAQSGTESAPLPQLCLQPSARPPTSRCLRQSLRASSLSPSAPAAASLLLFRLLRFPLLLLFLVLLLLLFFLLLLFPHLLPPQPPPPTALTPLPPGHPGPCRVFGPRSLCCGPLDPKPAAPAPKLLGPKHRQTRRFLHAQSSTEAVPCRLASRSLRWFRESGEDSAFFATPKVSPGFSNRPATTLQQ